MLAAVLASAVAAAEWEVERVAWAASGKPWFAVQIIILFRANECNLYFGWAGRVSVCIARDG